MWATPNEMRKILEYSHVGAYWGDRRESLDQCAEKLTACFEEFARIDPLVASWFRKGSTKAKSKTPIGTDLHDVRHLLERGRNRTDFGGVVIEELGYHVGVWNGNRVEIGLSATLGAFPKNWRINNRFGINLPPLNEESARLYQPAVARRLFEVVVEIFEPEWSTWVTPSLRKVQDSPPNVPDIGWMTYLSDVSPSEISLGIGKALGTCVLITAAEEFKDVSTESVLHIRQSLIKQSLLRTYSLPS